MWHWLHVYLLMTTARTSPVQWALQQSIFRIGALHKLIIWKSVSIQCIWILLTHWGLLHPWYGENPLLTGIPLVGVHSGCRGILILLSSHPHLIHSPWGNTVIFLPLGLQKQLGSREALDTWWSNLSFLGRFLACAALIRLFVEQPCAQSLHVTVCCVHSCDPNQRQGEASGYDACSLHWGKWGLSACCHCGVAYRDCSRAQKKRNEIGNLQLPLEISQPLQFYFWLQRSNTKSHSCAVSS